MVQPANEYNNVVTINGLYQELVSGGKNVSAKNLGDFVSKAEKAGGYYIGRFEAGKVAGNSNTFSIKKGLTGYNYINQSKASSLSRNLYSSPNFESDLLNSYAYDTAIKYIQECSGDTDYARENRFQNSLTTTGNAKNENNEYDVRCNIYDMAGNLEEWTTESSIANSTPCVYRGGDYNNDATYVSIRINHTTSLAYFYLAFRSILYL